MNKPLTDITSARQTNNNQEIPESKAEVAREVVESLDCLQRMLWDLKVDFHKPEELGSLLGCIARRAELLK